MQGDVSCQMFWEAVRTKGLGRRKTVDQTVTRAACSFQYSLNEKKMLQLRTEMVSLVRTGADLTAILFSFASPHAWLWG